MTQHPLDRPVWASLSTCHRTLSLGSDLARRYVRDVHLFASSLDDSPDAMAALAELVQPGEEVYILQVPEIRTPEALTVAKTGFGVQMVLRHALPTPPKTDDIIDLRDDDAAEMFALAKLTEPGPYLPRTHVLGHFVGIRRNGQLAAMAGERLHFGGFTEVSGVCTHPDFRGQGLARRLSSMVAARIQERGETAFLHSWKDNRTAIALYESMGFQHRCDVNVAILTRDG